MELRSIQKALVVGGGHGIGLALVNRLRETAPNAQVFATYRDESKAAGLIESSDTSLIKQLDPSDEGSLEQLSRSVEQAPGTLHLLINATGWLHDHRHRPEKSLRQINVEQMLEYFKVNSITTALLGKYFMSHFRHREESCFASLSAKVGSIEDNKIGGWYGYRSSKAALNMIKRTMAVEFSRSGCHCNLLAIHPGTTVTELSKPYIKNTKLQLHEPEESAANILQVIEQQPRHNEARFLSWDGAELPW